MEFGDEFDVHDMSENQNQSNVPPAKTASEEPKSGGEKSMFRLGQTGWIFTAILSILLLTSGLLIVLSTKFSFLANTTNIFFYMAIGLMVLALAGLFVAFWDRTKLNAEDKAYHNVADHVVSAATTKTD